MDMGTGVAAYQTAVSAGVRGVAVQQHEVERRRGALVLVGGGGRGASPESCPPEGVGFAPRGRGGGPRAGNGAENAENARRLL